MNLQIFCVTKKNLLENNKQNSNVGIILHFIALNPN